jgi:hypothetical protein
MGKAEVTALRKAVRLLNAATCGMRSRHGLQVKKCGTRSLAQRKQARALGELSKANAKKKKTGGKKKKTGGKKKKK